LGENVYLEAKLLLYNERKIHELLFRLVTLFWCKAFLVTKHQTEQIHNVPAIPFLMHHKATQKAHGTVMFAPQDTNYLNELSPEVLRQNHTNLVAAFLSFFCWVYQEGSGTMKIFMILAAYSQYREEKRNEYNTARDTCGA
jgi:uncharacterized protein YcbK (DUF882 family)